MGLTRGLNKIEIGDIANDGDIATVWVDLGDLDADSTATLTQADATETLFTAIQKDQPVDKDVTPGATTLVASVLDSDPDKLALLFGGTTSGTGSSKLLKAPAQAVTIEKSVKITPKKGLIITIPRGQLSAKLNYDLQKTGKMVIDLSIAVLAPTKAGVPPIQIGPSV